MAWPARSRVPCRRRHGVRAAWPAPGILALTGRPVRGGHPRPAGLLVRGYSVAQPHCSRAPKCGTLVPIGERRKGELNLVLRWIAFFIPRRCAT